MVQRIYQKISFEFTEKERLKRRWTEEAEKRKMGRDRPKHIGVKLVRELKQEVGSRE